METNYFAELRKVNVSDKTEKKNGLTYLSWSDAWDELKLRHPLANYSVKMRDDGRIYWDDGRTAWVVVSVSVPVKFDGETVNIAHTEILAIMDKRNQSIPVDKVTSTDACNSIQRAVTKAIARHGLGLYIYAGEDLPEAPSDAEVREKIESARDREELEGVYKAILAGGYAARDKLAAWCKRRVQELEADEAEAAKEAAPAPAPTPKRKTLKERAAEAAADKNPELEAIVVR